MRSSCAQLVCCCSEGSKKVKARSTWLGKPASCCSPSKIRSSPQACTQCPAPVDVEASGHGGDVEDRVIERADLQVQQVSQEATGGRGRVPARERDALDALSERGEGKTPW